AKELSTQLAEQLVHTPCWQRQATSTSALDVDCTATPDGTVANPALLDRLYQQVRARSWWTEWQGQQGVARDALQLSCDEAQRADAFDAALKKLHLDLAQCLANAGNGKNEALFAVAAQCRQRAAAARLAITKDPRYAIPKPKT